MRGDCSRNAPPGARGTVLAAAVCLVACTDLDAVPIPWRCLDVLDGGGDACKQPERCAWVAGRPDERFPWSVELVQDRPGPGPRVSELQHKRQCIEDYVRDGGGTLTHGARDVLLQGDATWHQMQAVCTSSVVHRCSVWARDGMCQGLPETHCRALPLCGRHSGRRLAAGASCVTRNAFAWCLPNPVGCTLVIVVALGPDGDCWWFSGGCGGGGEGWASGRGHCPDALAWDELPDCE